MPWFYLIVAGLFEIVWVTSMKSSQGFTRLWPSVITVATMLASFALLAAGMRSLPMGTSYAVWVGIGAAGAAIVGILYFDEPWTATRLVCIGAIIAAVVGLRLTHA